MTHVMVVMIASLVLVDVRDVITVIVVTEVVSRKKVV